MTSKWLWIRNGIAFRQDDGFLLSSGEKLGELPAEMGARPPSRPELWPESMDELRHWARTANPSLAILLIAESIRPLRPAGVQDLLVGYGLLESSEEAKVYWKKASKKLRSDSRLISAGKGTATSYRLATLAEGAAIPAAPFDRATGPGKDGVRWLLENGRSFPLRFSKKEARSGLVQVLDAFLEWVLTRPNPSHADWKTWETRLRRSAWLADRVGSAEEPADKAAECIRAFGGVGGKAPDRCFSHLAGVLRATTPKKVDRTSTELVLRLLEKRHELDDWEPLLKLMSDSWSEPEWARVLTYASRNLARIGARECAWLAERAFFRAHPQTGVELTRLALSRTASGTDLWNVLSKVGGVALESAQGEVENLLVRSLDRTLSKPTSSLDKAGLAEFINRREEAIEKRLNQELSERSRAASRREEEVRLEAERLRSALIEVEEARADAEKEREGARRQIVSMAGRMEIIRDEGRIESQVGAWRSIIDTIETLLDADPQRTDARLARVTDRLEAELRAQEVVPLATRGSTISFDPKRYQWLGQDEPSGTLEVIRRAYALQRARQEIIVSKGLVKEVG